MPPLRLPLVPLIFPLHVGEKVRKSDWLISWRLSQWWERVGKISGMALLRHLIPLHVHATLISTPILAMVRVMSVFSDGVEGRASFDIQRWCLHEVLSLPGLHLLSCQLLGPTSSMLFGHSDPATVLGTMRHFSGAYLNSYVTA